MAANVDFEFIEDENVMLFVEEYFGYDDDEEEEEEKFEMVSGALLAKIPPQPIKTVLIKNLEEAKAFIDKTNEEMQNLREEIQLYKNIKEAQNAEILKLKKDLAEEAFRHAVDDQDNITLTEELEEKLREQQDRLVVLADLNNRLEVAEELKESAYAEKDALFQEIKSLRRKVAIIPELMEENKKQQDIIDSMSSVVYYSKVAVVWLLSLFRRFFELVLRFLKIK